MNIRTSSLCLVIVLCNLMGILSATAAEPLTVHANQLKPVSISVRDTSIQEVFEMLSKKEQINILLGKGITGDVSVNLYEVTLQEAIKSIAEAAGYVAEYRNGTYVILDRKDAGQDAVNSNTRIISFKVQYSDTKLVSEILKKHLSRYGKITILEERKLLVIEDLPEFLERIRTLLTEIDKEPRQILIEAKILEVTLDDSESFGLDWVRLFNTNNGTGSIGTTGFSSPTSPGFFFSLFTSNIETTLTALNNKGRVRTLSTPKLLAMENQEAQVVIGDRIGFKVTTTVNQITTESVDFLESGIILKVTPSVDGSGRILMQIHPEVSTGTISTAGIPSQTTTEVTTQLLAENGQSIFIGGLIKNSINKTRASVPVLGKIPLIGKIFSKSTDTEVNTETVVLITPYIIQKDNTERLDNETRKVMRMEELLPPGLSASNMLWHETVKSATPYNEQ